MAMTRQNWTLNALSIELCQDRRALGRKLSTLRPDEEKTSGGKVTKRWKLSRVLAHLEGRLPAGRHGGNGSAALDDDRQTEAMLGEHHEFAELLTKHVYPALLDSRAMRRYLPALLVAEIGISKPQALRAFQLVAFTLSFAMTQFLKTVESELDGTPLPETDTAWTKLYFHGAPEIKFTPPPCVLELGKIGTEAYAAKHWPDKAA